MNSQKQDPGQQPPSAPRAVGVSGVLFAALFAISVTLIRQAMPADPLDPGAWMSDPILRGRVHAALNLVPFTGLAFLWFMGTLRNRIGLREDRFFATVFLGSGLLFVAMLFTTVAVAQGMIGAFAVGTPNNSETYRAGRGLAYALMNTFGMKMSAVFMFVTSTIGLRTGAFARSVSFAGLACGLILLLTIADFAWITLVFPGWALLVSLHILWTDRRDKSGTPAN